MQNNNININDFQNDSEYFNDNEYLKKCDLEIEYNNEFISNEIDKNYNDYIVKVDDKNIKIKKFKNYYCNYLCSISKFIPLNEELIDNIEKILTIEQLQILVDYAVLKNKISGVEAVFIKVPDFQMGKNSLKKFSLQGYEIVSACKIENLKTSDMVGGKIILEIENLLNYSAKQLSDINEFCAITDTAVLIRIGQDLEEVGKIVGKFGMSPIETIESFGLLDRECYILGLNFIDKDDQKLIKDYGATCIFSPQFDSLNGRGAINLYNFIYNDLKFGFSSETCYNIDMLFEAKLAKFNTSNLMYQNDLISYFDLIKAISYNQGWNLISFDKDELKENILDKKVFLYDERLEEIENKVKEIVQIIKEKIKWN